MPQTDNLLQAQFGKDHLSQILTEVTVKRPNEDKKIQGKASFNSILRLFKMY